MPFTWSCCRCCSDMMMPKAWCNHQQCWWTLAWCCCSPFEDDDDKTENTVNHHVLPALIHWQQSLVHPKHPYAKFHASNPPGFGVAPTLHPTWISKPGGVNVHPLWPNVHHTFGWDTGYHIGYATCYLLLPQQSSPFSPFRDLGVGMPQHPWSSM